MKKTITLERKYYQYPTKNEIDQYRDLIRISYFNFPVVNVFEELTAIQTSKHITEVKRRENLYYWDQSVRVRANYLRETFYNLCTHYNRAEVKELDDLGNQENYSAVNIILFQYYAEIFFLQLGTLEDNIGQVLNCYFNMGKKEKSVYFQYKFDNPKANNNFKIESCIGLEKQIENYLSFKFNKHEKIRNLVTHRFALMAQPDDIFELIDNNNINERIGYISNKDVFKLINESAQKISVLFDDLILFFSNN